MSFFAKAQDLQFSQFYMAPMEQNPALAGAEHDIEANINYRNQWQSVTIPFRTIAFSYDMRLTKPKENSGYWAAGINFYSDNEGNAQMGTTQGNLSLAYHVHTGQYSFLGAGVMGGYAQRVVNYGALTWGSQYDGFQYNSGLPGDPVGSTSKGYIDGSAGVNWCYDNTAGGTNVTGNHDQMADVGFAMFHVNMPRYSFYGNNENLYIRYVFHADGLVSVRNTNYAFAPGLLYYRQGTAQEIYVGTLVRYMLQQNSKYTGVFKAAAFSIGGYYRGGDALIAAMLLEYSNYAIGISYDINTSELTTASNGRGGFELSLRYVLPNPFTGTGSTKSMF